MQNGLVTPVEKVNFQFTLQSATGDNVTYGFEESYLGPPTPGTITIQTYGAEGDWIEGVFEGKLVQPETLEPVTITGGHFKVRRTPDVK